MLVRTIAVGTGTICLASTLGPRAAPREIKLIRLPAAQMVHRFANGDSPRPGAKPCRNASALGVVLLIKALEQGQLFGLLPMLVNLS